MFGKFPYIIAEVGSNWHSFDDCRESIEQAAKAGANAVKFQLFTAKDLYGVDLLDWSSKKWEMPEDWIQPLKLICDNNNIDFMCTVFNPNKVGLVDPYVSYHKVASSDIGYTALIENLAMTDKGLIVSTGNAKVVECDTVFNMVRNIRRAHVPELCFMYCEPSYPALRANHGIISLLKANYGYAGYSDHGNSHMFSVSSMTHAPHCIERHFKLSRITGTPDSGRHSSDQDDFGLMVSLIREKQETGFADDYLSFDRWFADHAKRRMFARGFYRPIPESK